MRKKIGIAVALLLATGALSASAQTAQSGASYPAGTVGCRAGDVLSGGVCYPAPTTRVQPQVVPINAAATSARPTPVNTNARKPEPVPALYNAQMNPAGITPGQIRKESQSEINARAKMLRETVSTVRKETLTKMKDNRQEMEERAKELRESAVVMHANLQNEAQKKRLENARNQMEMVGKKLDDAIVRVQGLFDRVSDRLTKLEADGVNVSVSRGHLAEAKVKLDEARTKIAAAKLEVEVALAERVSASATTTAPKDFLKSVRASVDAAAKILQEAHKHIAIAISTAKPGLNKQGTGTVPLVPGTPVPPVPPATTQ